MKTHIYYLIIGIVLSTLSLSCSVKEFTLETDGTPTHRINTRTRSLFEAQECANEALNYFDIDTKGHVKRIISSECVTNRATKSAGEDTLCYIFNFENEEGFAIINANKRLDPFICITESGSFTSGQPSGVPAFDEYYGGFINYLEHITPEIEDPDSLEFPTDPFLPHSYTTLRYVGSYVLPLVHVKWGQRDIYGEYCPNGISGCAATAMAQIMSSQMYPDTLILSTSMGPYSSGDSIVVHWNKIRQHTISHSDSLSCTPYHNEISSLLRDIGFNINMVYNESSSGASPFYVSAGFEHYGYITDDLTTANINSIVSSINNRRPVYMRGKVEEEGGHAWVADGYKDYQLYRDTYNLAQIGFGYEYSHSELIEEYHALHINWGWNGIYNGYFNFNIYDPNNAVIYDGSYGSGAPNFTNNIWMIANIRIND